MNKFIIIIFFTFLLTYIKAQNADTLELRKTWATFSKAIITHDLTLLQSLVKDTIYCPFCAENTATEQKLMRNLQENESYPDTLYKFIAKISANKFIQEDIYQICDSSIVHRLTVDSLLYFVMPHKYNLNYEVIVTTIDPTENHQGKEIKFDGQQYSFSFEKNNGKFILNGFSTIP